VDGESWWVTLTKQTWNPCRFSTGFKFIRGENLNVLWFNR
jgi:hypothetical protein